MPKPPNPPLTIAQILALPEAAEGSKTWVNGSVSAEVVSVKAFPNKPESSIATLKDATGQIDGTFWGRPYTTMSQYIGNTIKISGQGLSRRSRTYKDKTSYELAVGESNPIVIMGDAKPAPATSPAPQQSQGQAQAVRSTPPPEVTIVSDRVSNYLKIAAEVHSQYQANKEHLPAFSPSDLNDITNHISKSYNEGYIHGDPVFVKEEKGWRDVTNRDGIKLGDMEPSALALSLLKVVVADQSNPSVQKGAAALNEAKKEHRWTCLDVADLAASTLSGFGVSWFKMDLYEMAKAKFGAETEADVALEQWGQIFAKPDVLSTELAKFHEEADSVPF